MEDFDRADLDGDGEFDAIDIMILEEGEQGNENSSGGKSGCCVLLLVGASIALSTSYSIASLLLN